MARYDLTHEAVRFKTIFWWYRFALGAFLAGEILGTVYLIIEFTQKHWWDFYRTGSIFFLALIAFLFGYLVFRVYRPGASYVEVDERGVGFFYPWGEIRAFSWTDPSVRLRFVRTPGASDFTSHGIPMRVYLDIGFYRTFMSEEALESIVSLARENGFTVAEGQSKRPGWTLLTVSGSDAS